MAEESMAAQFMGMLRNMAEDLDLDESETESFVDSGMARKGFKKISSWADPDPEDGGKGGGDFFSQRRREGQTRQVGQQRGSGGNGAGWQCGN